MHLVLELMIDIIEQATSLETEDLFEDEMVADGEDENYTIGDVGVDGRVGIH